MWMGVRVGVGVDGCEGWGRCGWVWGSVWMGVGVGVDGV